MDGPTGSECVCLIRNIFPAHAGLRHLGDSAGGGMALESGTHPG